MKLSFAEAEALFNKGQRIVITTDSDPTGLDWTNKAWPYSLAGIVRNWYSTDTGITYQLIPCQNKQGISS